MLSLPTKGFSVSVNKHNVDLPSLVDWIEACITFDDDRVSKIDVVDVLLEESIYTDQDFAKERLSDAWMELRRRAKCLGNVCPYGFEGEHLVRKHSWQEVSPFAFCLMLSLQPLYRSIRDLADYPAQGLLFEQLTEGALSEMGWSTHLVGWSKAESTSIALKVSALANHLGEPEGTNLGLWTTEHAKDGGLDVVCHLPFNDGWAGRPVLFVQCASGENWESKRSTPILSIWRKLLDFTTDPIRGISIPFALMRDEFRRKANYDLLVLLMDRHRVCAPRDEVDRNWVAEDLRISLNNWLDSRVAALLTNRSSAV